MQCWLVKIMAISFFTRTAHASPVTTNSKKERKGSLTGRLSERVQQTAWWVSQSLC